MRTALYNYLFAKRHNGTFVLRIEDTDTERFVPGAEDYVRRSLEWAGITPDEGEGYGGPHAPYRQSDRNAEGLYNNAINTLLIDGNAYLAFDTKAELDAKHDAAPGKKWSYNALTRQDMRNSLTLPSDEVKRLVDAGEPHVVRFKVPRNETVRLHDIIRGWVSVETNTLDDKVLVKADGMPTYHLANIADDIAMGITHVIRGEEWLPSAPLHVLIFKALGADTPTYAHLPLIMGPNGKLSKRDGVSLGIPVFPLAWTDPVSGETFDGYREFGFLPDGFTNFLAFLGWNPGGDREVYKLAELVDIFGLERCSKSPAKFNVQKTRWFNAEHMKAASDEDLTQALSDVYEMRGIEDAGVLDTDALRAVKIAQTGCQTAVDLFNNCQYLFWHPAQYDADLRANSYLAFATALAERLYDNQRAGHYGDEGEKLDVFAVKAEFDRLYAEMESPSFTKKQALMAVRYVLCGENKGPQLFDMIVYNGAYDFAIRANEAAGRDV